ncbi:retrotransposon protein, putative, ty1-copia subclass [Tanacetum coccineum]|uniref:Retrotransposon protein, putative, ty1-copia subclass n=1 Tax=Tanacetum coccineum TaxID=301880 RepID=A0ABQ5AC27_9ASTR
MMIKGGKIQKAKKKSLNAKGNNKVKGKRKDKKVYIPKPKNPKPTAMERPAKDVTYHHCKEVGHWKRNCLVYLAELLKKKKQVGSASSSDNCHYAPTITRGVVSVSRLVDNGFVQCFTDYGILVSKNDVLYFNAIARNGIYEIDMHDLVPNVNSIYNVSNKRVKRNLDSTYLWHLDWKSSKQSTIAMSATESEYIAASEAAMEAVWIRKFISGLGIVPTINEPYNMYCDNSAAVHYANEPGVQRECQNNYS